MSLVINQLLVLFFGAVLTTMIATIPFLNSLDTIERKSEIKINNQSIIAEVVSSPADREKGLSGRAQINVNEGMLFVFEENDKYPFWMKGMKFPIDIVWILQDRIIGFEENVMPPEIDDPSYLKVYRSPLAINKVLELKAGRVKLLRAELGQRVLVKPLIPGITKK